MRTRIFNFRTSPGMGQSLSDTGRGTRLVALGVAAALLLSACSTTGVSVSNANDQQLAPVANGNVQTSALPPIGPNGEVQGPVPAGQNGMTPASGTPGSTQIANANGSIQAVPPVGALPNSSGRDLTGGLTVEKLLGRWTVVSGSDQCSLNLTETAKAGTGRYRASAPACALKGMTAVASWALAGTQVQLFDDKNNIIAALILSGNRFIGTLSGGQGISVVG